LSAQGVSNVSGEFIINMGSLVVEDKELPSDKKEMLKGHLAAKDYFDVSKFPEVLVKVNGYKDGKLATTISLLGKEMKQDIAVSLTNDGSKATISGNFDLDLKALNLEGFKVNEEKPKETIKSIISFDLNIVLNNK
jgi:polyisoprenoid-binding protein YceI